MASKKVIGVFSFLLVTLFMISFVRAEVVLNSPADDSTFLYNEVLFNSSGNISGGLKLTNMSLYTNESGNWELKNTTNLISTGNFTQKHNLTMTDCGTACENVIYELGFNFTMNQNANLTYAHITVSNIGKTRTAKLYFQNGTSIYNISTGTSGQDFYFPNILLNSGNTYILTMQYNSNYHDSISPSASQISDSAITWENGIRITTGTITSESSFHQFDMINLSYDNSPTSSTQTWNRTITDGIIWNVQSCNDGGSCEFAISNYSLGPEIIPPVIDVQSPIGTLGQNAVGQNETLNVTFTDSNLDSCWYNYNGTNVSIDGCQSGVKNFTQFILESMNTNMTLYANDSLGNLNSTFIEWNYNMLSLNLTYNEEVLDLSIEDFVLYVQSAEEITESKMNYNGVDYASSLLSLGSGLYRITNSIQVPDVAVDTNYTFYFNITTVSENFITDSNNQSVFILLIDNCASYTNELFNITLYDEKTLLTLLGTIEVNLELFNADKVTALTTAVNNFYNMSNMQICSNVNLTSTGYYYDLELRYYVDPTNTSSFLYVPEFYHIQKASVSNFLQTINLYNLNINQSTEFEMFYRDNNYVARPNVLLQIERKYVSEGIFRVVEIPITSSEGTAVGHFDLNNYKYRIVATENGIILNTFDNPAIVCESELSGQCTLTLNGQGDPDAYRDYEEIQDISYDIRLNDTNITLEYVIPSGETKQVRVTMIQESPFTDPTTICNQSITSSAGSFTCTANSTIGDSSVTIEIRVDGVLVIRTNAYYQEDLGDFFLLNNYAIAAFLVILLVTMMVSSPKIMVVTAIFSVAFLGMTFLLKGSSIGLVLGSFSWLVVAGIIILIKINKKDET